MLPSPYVFVALEIGSRRLIHFNVTEDPAAEWTLQQLREALPDDQDYKFLLHDRQKTFSSGLDVRKLKGGQLPKLLQRLIVNFRT